MTASREVIIRNQTGLHARPAARLVERAREYPCEILIELEGRTASSKSLLRVLTLGISAGSRVRIIATGPDEGAAVAELVALLNTFAVEEQGEAAP